MSTSLESFVNVLRRSGLIDEAAIAESVAELQQSAAVKTAAPGTGAAPLSGEALAEKLVTKGLVTAWQATKLLQGKHKGFFLGKYKLLRLLGKGGMSSVYLAEHVLMRRRCAIKVLPWKLVKDSSYLQRFHREAQAVASLDHPNIVRAYDVDHERDGSLEIHFLVMEYVEGKNLFDLVQQGGPLPVAVAADYIRQGALGLQHAHDIGMVHRDVKPGNLIVDQNGVVKLMDLGLARIAENEDHSLTVAHDERVLGTADYLAPEQAVDSHLVDTRADIYSLGCTLYFLLTGRPPFNEGTLAQRLLAHQSKEPTSAKAFRNDLPDSLVAILNGLMAKDREKRIQTAGDIVTLLDHWLKNHANNTETAAYAASATTAGGAKRTDGTPEKGVAGVALRRNQTPDQNPLGDFLSSLSDVDAAMPQQPSSARQIVDSATMKLNRSETVDTSESAGGHHDHFDILPDDDNPFVVSRGTSSIKTGSRSGSSKSGKRSRKQGKPQFDFKTLLPSDLLKRLQKERIPIAIAAGILAITIVGAVVYSFIAGEKKTPTATANVPAVDSITPAKSETPPPAPVIQRPEVSGSAITVGPKGNFGTLKEAIEYLKLSSLSSISSEVKEIQIEGDQTLKESLSIDNSGLGGFPRGIKISGQSNTPPRLQPDDQGPAVLLDSVEGLTIENLVINCQGRSEGILTQGYSSSSSFINLTFENIQKTGFSGKGLSGLSGRPVTIQRCTFRTTSSSANAISFDASSGSDARFLIIDQCRFLGPMASGISLIGSGESIEVTRNVFHEVSSGIQISGVEPICKKLRFANNTFAGGQNGFSFESTFSSSSNGFVFENNLFVKQSGSAVSTSSNEAKLADLTKGGAARFNWTDRAPGDESQFDIFKQNGVTGTSVEFASEDAQSPDFLKPKTAKISNPGAPGPHKFFGAISP